VNAVVALVAVSVWVLICFGTARQSIRDLRAGHTDWLCEGPWDYHSAVPVEGRRAKLLSAVYLAGSVLSAVVVAGIVAIAVFAP
jgi:hypothetical protein